ncbi:MAG: hypothetical protein LBC87_03340 [Fibromonadaceae bacterium]|jgi:uncharacterized protein (TIGR02145 family)|nr:hypothetical protein [Fibromonadaceae bacterium]
MGNRFSKLALTAAFWFAMTFSLSCSQNYSNGDGDLPFSSSKGFWRSSSSGGNGSSGSRSSSGGNGGGRSSSSGGNGSSIEYGSMKDNDGKKYKTVKIGNQIWMAENLDYDVNGSGSVCHSKDPANCDKYGRLYNWTTAMIACPSDWRLPTNDDWEELISYVESENGCSDCAGIYLKSKNDWNDYNGKSGNGKDTYGFEALPGGDGRSSGEFLNIGNGGFWWTATGNANSAHHRNMGYYYDRVALDYHGDRYLFSVRCVQGGGPISSSSSRPASSSSDGKINLLENATYRTGDIPTGTTGKFEVETGNTIISGGSTILTITSDRELDKLYVQLTDYPGYYEVKISQNDLVSSASRNYIYNVLLQFTQNLLQGETSQTAKDIQFIFSAASGSAVSPSVSKSIETIKVGGDALQISLSWTTKVDLDLHITPPSGTTIYYKNKKVDNGELDLDANVGCPDPGDEDKRNENVFFTALEDGDYLVEVNMYTNCITTPTRYIVSAYLNGKIFEFSAANQNGVFAANTEDGTKKTIGVIRIKNGVAVR